MNELEKYPALEGFFGAYLHQDWRDEFESLDNAVAAFKKSESLEEVTKAKNELAMLAQLSESQIQKKLLAMGCYYSPTADNLTCAQWIAQLRSLFR